MISPPSSVGGSFRDPTGRVYEVGGRILRGVDQASLDNFLALEATEFYREARARGLIVATQIVPGDDARAVAAQGWAGVLEHEKLPLISYPYEWTFSMLKDAALLHLDLLERSLSSGWTIKDSTPYNIQFVGSVPTFVDLPSFIPRQAGEHWAGYRQFCMLFLYPLMLKAHLGIDFNPILRASLDGLSPREASRYFTGLNRFKKGVLTHVSFPAFMERRVEEREKDRAPAKQRVGIRQSDSMVLGLVQSVRRLIGSLKSAIRHTEWSEYSKTHSYDKQAFDEKVQFVTQAAAGGRFRIVWDIGSNTGTFSQICARHAEIVIAVDGDHDAVEKLYQAERARGGNKILPLFMNLANISPNQGWAGRERTAFDQRNRPDFVVCLALIHHICLSANIPIALFLDWLQSLEAKLVIEFVDRTDEMVQKLIANKKERYSDYGRERFEQELRNRFRILASQDLKGGSRTMFLCEPAG